MQKKRKNALFGSLYGLVLSANLAALSIVLGKYLAINVDQYIRISFENLPIIVGGFFFGPIVGAVIGAVADLIGCVLVGYAINPIITCGAAAVGAVAGIVGWLIFRNQSTRARRTAAAFVATAAAHVLGSMIIKSIGMYVYYGHTIEVLWVRIPLYICIATAEGGLMAVLASSRVFMRERDRVIPPREKSKNDDVQ
ncbi:MAG: folate family ECF transporter S component [Ruminococcaceae bacterium]|nr:folate family ECF transporter S component [Oscillospiraceae bacterium]